MPIIIIIIIIPAFSFIIEVVKLYENLSGTGSPGSPGQRAVKRLSYSKLIDVDVDCRHGQTNGCRVPQFNAEKCNAHWSLCQKSEWHILEATEK